MHRVLITDAKSGGYDYNAAYFAKLSQWAKTHCESFVAVHVQDVSDHSYMWDEIAEFTFADERDAVWFTTAWGE